jgi:hypothetical protein
LLVYPLCYAVGAIVLSDTIKLVVPLAVMTEIGPVYREDENSLSNKYPGGIGCLYNAAVTAPASLTNAVTVPALKIEYPARLVFAGRATLEVAVALTAVTTSALRISSATLTATLEGFRLTSPIV